MRKQLFCETFDNFSGHHSFLTNTWAADQLILTYKIETEKASHLERFIYKKLILSSSYIVIKQVLTV